MWWLYLNNNSQSRQTGCTFVNSFFFTFQYSIYSIGINTINIRIRNLVRYLLRFFFPMILFFNIELFNPKRTTFGSKYGKGEGKWKNNHSLKELHTTSSSDSNCKYVDNSFGNWFLKLEYKYFFILCLRFFRLD